MDIGIAFVMNDYRNFIYPKSKSAKCWDYDISNGARVKKGKILNTSIGGKAVNILLNKNYEFRWEEFGGIWFAELEGYL